MGEDDDFLQARSPVPVVARPAVTTTSRQAKVAALEKFTRRIAGLQPGRYEIILSVGDDGVADWTVRPLGRVER